MVWIWVVVVEIKIGGLEVFLKGIEEDFLKGQM